MKIGPAQPQYEHVVALEPRASEWKLGADVKISQAKDAQTDKQRLGFHWLLRKWKYMDPGITKDLDRLKSDVLMVQWGAIKVTDGFGNEHFMPVKRTTTEWAWDSMSYVDKPCTREAYSALIETVYMMAAKDGIDLPELLPEHKNAI